MYVLHLQPAYRHARHYIGWARVDLHPADQPHWRRLAIVRAALLPASDVKLTLHLPGPCHPERRLKRWHTTGEFCPRCRAIRGDHPLSPQ